MKLTTIIFCVTLIVSVSKSQAKAQNGEIALSDTTRDEFNLKKKSTAQLISGKSPGTLLSYYEFYLQEKDLSRANSLVYDILRSSGTVEFRHQISLISYRYTLNTRAQQLFLSNTDKIKEYRVYLLKIKASSLKSNDDTRAHFYDLVTLDSAYYKIAPDTVVKKQMAGHYNSLAWYSILTQKLKDVGYYLDQSIKYDPQSKYPDANRPLLFLLQGRYKEARALYLQLKDQPFDEPNMTFKDEFLIDFKELETVGVTNNDIKKITRLLNSKSTR